MDRKQQADGKYRRLFYELKLDADFDYIRFEKKDRIWFRCKRCGLEAPRGNDVFKGKQKRLLCKKCGNGTRLYSDEVSEILAYYSEGHSVSDTCQRFNVGRTMLNDWVKERNVTNGRTFEEGGRECNQRRADEVVAQAGHSSKNLSYYARAKLHGAPAEVGITLRKLIKRDGLTCKICGLPCFDGGDYLADLYPTIDHIIPISKGGGHTWNNVQIAHRICNRNKSNLIGEEWNNVS